MPTRQDIEELYLPTGRVITEEWYSKLIEVLHEFKDELDGITPVISYGYVRGDIIPEIDLALNLGLKTLRFKQVHAGWGYFTYHLQSPIVKVLQEPTQSDEAVRKAELDAHKTASPIDHPDASITRAKLISPFEFTNLILEKRTDDVVDEGRIFYRTDTQEVKVGTGTQAILAGARKLSQLEIDVDKDWGGHGISNLSYLDASSFKLAGTEFLGSDRLLKTVRIARYYLDEKYDYITSTEDRPILYIYPYSPHEYFLTLLLMRIDISNPSGSGATAYWRLVAELDDDSEKTIISGSVPEGYSRTYTLDEHDVILPDGTRQRIYWNIPSGRTIKRFIFYGYCSAEPPLGYQPSIRVRDMNAIQV